MRRVAAPWSASAKLQAWRSMWGWAENGRDAALLHVFRSRLTVERCKGLRCSLTKNVLQFGCIRARCLSYAPIAFSSSPHKGFVVENPSFNLAMCKTLPLVSTCSSFKRQASETRKPWRKIKSSKQPSRALLRLPRVAGNQLSDFKAGQIVASGLAPSGGPVSERFSSCGHLHHFVESFSTERAPKPL
jgi:hypothetical protein